MNLIFDWSDDFYEEKQEWRGDAKMLSLEIFQRECCFASAKVTICFDDILPKNNSEIFSKKYAKIGAQYFEKQQNGTTISRTVLIFSGRLVAFPLALEKGAVQLEFIAEPPDYQQQLQEFIQRNISEYRSIDKHQIAAQPLNFDELFFSENDIQNPTAFLESNSKCFYWNMKSGKLSLSDINKGFKNIAIDGTNILEKSLKISLAREPYKNISINLSTDWTQRTSGLLDLYPFIAQKFSEGIICSFTNIKSKIQKLCSLHSEDYDALSCNVKEADPSALIPLQKFAKTSRKFLVQKQDNEEKTKKIEVQFKKFYFYGEMLFCWHRKQKLSENITLNVENSKINRGREKKIFMRLNSIQLPKEYPFWNFFTRYHSGDKIIFEGSIFECSTSHFSSNFFDEKNWKKIGKIPDALPSDTCESFFKTKRGKNAIKYAIQKAIALINYSARYIEISFAVDAHKFLDATINDQITLMDSRFNDGKISGKITKICFLASAKKRILQITIGCSLQNFSKNSSDQINEYLRNLWSENNDKNNDRNGTKNDSLTFSLADIVRDVEVINPPEEQEKILIESNAKSLAELKSHLKNHQTKIKIFLASLKGSASKNVELPTFFLK